jgi:hypothetical protein
MTETIQNGNIIIYNDLANDYNKIEAIKKMNSLIINNKIYH